MSVEFKVIKHNGEEMLSVTSSDRPSKTFRVAPRVFKMAIRRAFIYFKLKDGAEVPAALQNKFKEAVYLFLKDSCESQIPNPQLLPKGCASNPRQLANPRRGSSVMSKKIEEQFPVVFDEKEGLFAGDNYELQKWRYKSSIVNLTNMILERAFGGEIEILGSKFPLRVKEEELDGKKSSFEYYSGMGKVEKGVVETLRYYRLYVLLLVMNHLMPLFKMNSNQILQAEKTEILKKFQELAERGDKLAKIDNRRRFSQQCLAVFEPLANSEGNERLIEIFTGKIFEPKPELSPP